MSELKTNELVQWITKAGKKERIAEFQYPFVDGIFVQLAYASKFVFQQIREIAREVYTDVRTRRQEERLNEEKLRHEYAKRIIKEWRGLTVKRLREMIPGIEDIMQLEGSFSEDTEVAFSLDIAEAIMAVSIEFESWVIDIAGNVQNFAHVAEKKKEQAENLG